MKALVSVIIPTYQRSDKLAGTIESVLNQTYRHIEIIVVDDNLPESPYRAETESLMERYRGDDRIVYIKHDMNLGGAEARNTGIKHSRGDFLSFLDNDDEFFSNKIENEIALYTTSADSSIAFVMSEMEYVYPNEKVKITDRSHLFKDQPSLLKAHLLRKGRNGFVGTPTFLFKREIIEEINGFDNVSIRQEYCLLLKILGHGYKGVYLNQVTVKVYVSDDSITRKYSYKKELDIAKVYRLQKKYTDLLTKTEKLILIRNHIKDLLIFLYLSKNYKRLLINLLLLPYLALKK